ncbi:MAG: N-acetylglucosamine kinase [Gemmatimonadales bacterium]
MIVVGVDAGGSRTRVGVWRDGERLGDGQGSGAAMRPGRALQSAALIATAAKSTLAKLGITYADLLVAGVAGAGRREEAELLREALRGEGVADRVRVTTDIDLALAAAPGVDAVLMAGTGSVGIARGDGKPIQVGGHGWQMGDEGGGYWIGRQALAAVGRSADGRAEPTALTELLLKIAAAPEARDLAAWAVVASPREVATLAPAVATAASSGDAAAERILELATEELEALVRALARRRGAPLETIALGGGLLRDGPLRERLTRALEGSGIRVDPAPLEALEGVPALAAG